MKQPPADNKNKKVQDIIDILSSAESEIEKEVKSEEDEDSRYTEDKAWKLAASDLKERELLKLLSLNNIDFSDGIIFRRILTSILLKLTMVWLVFIAVIVALQGLHRTILPWPGNYIFGFHLESNVIIALLTTTTLTVVGLFLVVTRHIFYRGNGESKKQLSAK